MNKLSGAQHRHFWRALSVPLFVLGVLLFLPTQSALADEVECSSIRLNLSGDGYDLTCETDNGSDVTFESLEASAVDGSHFLVIADLKTNFRYIFRSGTSLRKNLTDAFSGLTVEHWRSGKAVASMITSEFDSDYKTIPSTCVGFQGYYGYERGGWRRHVFGFGCSRVGNRAQIYDALKRVNFPK